jgi:hypothetical protein
MKKVILGAIVALTLSTGGSVAYSASDEVGKMGRGPVEKTEVVAGSPVDFCC